LRGAAKDKEREKNTKKSLIFLKLGLFERHQNKKKTP
jgi:hypothetical protein